MCRGACRTACEGVTDVFTSVKSFTVQNLSNHTQKYRRDRQRALHGLHRAQFASVRIAIGNEQLATSHNFSLRAGEKVKIFVEIRLEPDTVPQVAAGVRLVSSSTRTSTATSTSSRRAAKGDELHVPWHVTPLAAADAEVFPTALDLTSGSADLAVLAHGAGMHVRRPVPARCRGPVRDRGGKVTSSRSAPAPSSGSRSTATPEGVPAGARIRSAGIDWLTFLTQRRHPDRADRVRGGGRQRPQHHRDDRDRCPDRRRGRRRVRGPGAGRRRADRQAARWRDRNGLRLPAPERLQRVRRHLLPGLLELQREHLGDPGRRRRAGADQPGRT